MAGSNDYSDEDAFIVLKNLPNLRKFTAYGCKFGWEGVSIIAANHSLWTLDISDNHFIEHNCNALGRHSLLTSLDLSKCRLR